MKTQKNLAKTERQITVQPFYRFNQITPKIVSEIRFRGVWLAEAGFLPSQKVSLEIRENQIIINAKTTRE